MKKITVRVLLALGCGAAVMGHEVPKAEASCSVVVEAEFLLQYIRTNCRVLSVSSTGEQARYDCGGVLDFELPVSIPNVELKSKEEG